MSADGGHDADHGQLSDDGHAAHLASGDTAFADAAAGEGAPDETAAHEVHASEPLIDAPNADAPHTEDPYPHAAVAHDPHHSTHDEPAPQEAEHHETAQDDPVHHAVDADAGPHDEHVPAIEPHESDDHVDATQMGYDAVEQALGAALFFDEQPDEHGFFHEGGSGYVPMQTKPDAFTYQPAISVRFGRLPNKVDLRALMAPVEDQGAAGSSVAHAVAGAYQYLVRRVTKQSRELSPLFVAYNGRWREGGQDHGGGNAIQPCIEALSRFGACSASLWPADPRLATRRPGADAYQDAAPPRIQDMAQVPLKLQAWKQALAEGKPIVFGTAVFDAFDDCTQMGGVVMMPAPADVPNGAHRLHAMCAVGYSENEKVFIVRNSRGPDWGDGGYCYMPYDYVLNPRLNDGDCWVLTPKSAVQPPREAWSDDSRPVANAGQGVDGPIGTHTIDDYANVAVDLFEAERRPYEPDIGEDYARYAALASKGSWHEMEDFDREAFLSGRETQDAHR